MIRLDRSAPSRADSRSLPFATGETLSRPGHVARGVPARRLDAGLSGLDLAVARRAVGDQRAEKGMGGLGDLFDRPLEGLFVRLGRLGEAADLPHELEGGVTDLAVGDGRLEVEEGLDVSAHGGSPSGQVYRQEGGIVS